MPASSFLKAFALTAAIGFGGLAALNWSVDPYDQYGPHGLAPLTLTARGAKSLGVAQATDAVEGLVLGSSRVLTLSPAELEARTGVGFYNAGVYYGRTEDFLALTRRYQTTHQRSPRELVIGLDIDAFADQIGPDPELIRTAELRREVPECVSLADRWQPTRELLSWHQTSEALKLLSATARDQKPALEEHFAADGSIVYEGRNRRIQSGEYDWTEAYNYDRGVYLGLFRQYRRLSPMRQNAWRELMRLCETNHVELTVFLTPMHPRLLAELQSLRTFDSRREEVTRFVNDTLPSGAEFVDMTDITSFAGDPDQFYDAVHLRSANASRVVNALFRAETPSAMLFNSYIFVFVFLPITLALWWTLPRAGVTRMGLLVAASYVFYGWWDWRFLGLMAVSTLVDYWAGIGIARATSDRGKRGWLAVSIVSNLGMLATFKYAGFAAESWNAIAEWVHHGGLVPTPEIVLPVGISFYTFQTMSYSIDLYRGHAKPATSLLHFAAYVSMFPQLVAGPIVRYADIDEQLRSMDRKLDRSQFASGVWLFVVGLAQKLLLADVIASRIDPLLDPDQTLQFAAGWYAMLGYSCQLYFDFSGYSNMAVGLGRMLGFEFCQNFDSPYQASSIQDFWRRWHISLSTMLRDYLFIPLGGSRGRLIFTLRNLFVVMLLGGLWHGAGWTFVLWGAYHGALLAIAACWRHATTLRLPYPMAAAITFVAVVFGWVLFRCETLSHAGSVAAAMVGAHGIESHALRAIGGPVNLAVLTALLSIAWFAPNAWRFTPRFSSFTGVFAALVFVVCVLRFDSASPFLYFRF